MYSLETGASLGSLRNPTGTELRAVPVLFAHNGNAIVGGSTTGIVRIWDAIKHRVHQRILVKGRCILCAINDGPLTPLSADNACVLAISVSRYRWGTVSCRAKQRAIGLLR